MYDANHLTEDQPAISVRAMSIPRDAAIESMGVHRSVGSAGSAWYWFSFAYYYGSPVALVEQEVCRR